MQFSVVIPTFNRRELLARTLESVWGQRCSDFEVIIVDDGSSDATFEYLLTLGDRVRVIKQARQGPGAARNAGAASATGNYLAFVDSDDLWFPWTLEVIATVIAQRSPALIAGQVLDFEGETLPAAVTERTLECLHFKDYLASSRYPVSPGAGTIFVARRAFVDCGGFATGSVNAEDHDLALRLGTAPGFAQVTSPSTVAWRRHASSETADLSKSIDGVQRLIDQERSGRYPGGAARAAERRRIITRHVRPTSLACLRSGRPSEGLRLYQSTFAWNAAAGLWRYLAAFPMLRALSSVRSAG
jgi:GT2 family glycosyltransferase